MAFFLQRRLLTSDIEDFFLCRDRSNMHPSHSPLLSSPLEMNQSCLCCKSLIDATHAIRKKKLENIDLLS